MAFDYTFVLKSLEAASRDLEEVPSSEIVRGLKTTMMALESSIKHEANVEEESSNAIEVMIKDAVKDSISDRWSLKNVAIGLTALSAYSLLIWKILIMGINEENKGRYIEAKGNLPIIESAKMYKFSEREKLFEGLKQLKDLKSKVDLMEDQSKTNEANNKLLHTNLWNAIKENGEKK
jgi:hypothetical protein